MKHEDRCDSCKKPKENEFRLEISHSDGAGRRKRSILCVNQAWTTINEGNRTLKYTRYCECGLKINGKFTSVTRWMIRTKLEGER